MNAAQQPSGRRPGMCVSAIIAPSDVASNMTFIDWSDPEGMLGLFVELVADERVECLGDTERLSFVEDLLAALRTVEAEVSSVPMSATVQRLRSLRDGVDPEFSDDPVMAHFDDLLDELERSGVPDA